MKKLIFSLLVLLVFCTTAKADPFRFGVVAGMNISKGETSSNVNYKGWSPDSEGGWFAGVQLKASLPIIGLGFDASLIYSQESISVWSEVSSSNITSADASLVAPEHTTDAEKLDYLAVPLHLRYDLSIPGANWVAVPFIFTGPQAGLTLSKIDNSYHDKITTKDLIWRYDLGGGLILFKHLQAAYSYSFPLSKTYEGKFYDKSKQIDEDYKQGVHRLSVTYFF